MGKRERENKGIYKKLRKKNRNVNGKYGKGKCRKRKEKKEEGRKN